MVFPNWEEAENFQANYGELATAVESYIEECEKADKEEVEELLAQLKTARATLVSKRSEQQALVDKYANDAEAYAEVAKAAQEAQREAERKEQEEHPERYAGNVYTGINTYPWQEDCPGSQDNYGTTVNGRYIGGYVCECVSYVGWKAYEEYDLYLAWGNAYNWDNRARALGYTVDHNPEAGTKSEGVVNFKADDSTGLTTGTRATVTCGNQIYFLNAALNAGEGKQIITTAASFATGWEQGDGRNAVGSQSWSRTARLTRRVSRAIRRSRTLRSRRASMARPRRRATTRWTVSTRSPRPM